MHICHMGRAIYMHGQIMKSPTVHAFTDDHFHCTLKPVIRALTCFSTENEIDAWGGLLRANIIYTVTII